MCQSARVEIRGQLCGVGFVLHSVSGLPLL